jgi:membrane protein YdbS with pleckstrin-like domain
VSLIDPQDTPSDNYLIPGEKTYIDVHRHWAMIADVILVWIGALILAGVLTALVEGNQLVTTYIWLLFLALTAWVIYRFLAWYAQKFVVTDRRLLLVTGLINRRVAVMPLRKVTDMTYQRTGVGRLFGYGELIIESAAQDQALREVDYLPYPDALYQKISELLFSRPEADLTVPPLPGRRVPRVRPYAPSPRPYVRETTVMPTGDPATQPIPVVRPVEPHGTRPVRDPRTRRPRT